MEPTTTQLRENFQEQVRSINERISILAQELEQAKELRLKLLGGLETLQILDPVEEPAPEEETPSED
jgi:hypothetical protein